MWKWDVAKQGSPYPGLMRFTRGFAPVFFGREAEVRELLDRLQRLRQVIKSLPVDRVGEELRAFASPQQHLVRLLDNPSLAREIRDSIGRHLAMLGDSRPGVGLREDDTPDIDWVEIPGGNVELEDGVGKA